MQYDICFHYDGDDTPKIIVAKEHGWEWSDAEKGLIPNPDGTYFHVASSLTVPEAFDPNNCFHKWKVNDVDNPTAVEML